MEVPHRRRHSQYRVAERQPQPGRGEQGAASSVRRQFPSSSALSQPPRTAERAGALGGVVRTIHPLLPTPRASSHKPSVPWERRFGVENEIEVLNWTALNLSGQSGRKVLNLCSTKGLRKVVSTMQRKGVIAGKKAFPVYTHLKELTPP